MKTTVFGLLLALVANFATAQKAPIKYGDVPLEDLKMTVYEKDSTAPALVLVDYGQTTMNYSQSDGFQLSYERITRIKILKKDGLEWANFTIELYRDGTEDEKVSGIKGTTYNLVDGKVVETKLKDDGIFKEKYSDNLNIVKLSLPNVKEGSVVEVTYKITSDFVYNFQDWEFQSKIPVKWSEYRARVPEYYHYDKYTQGYITMTVAEETQGTGSVTLTSKDRSDQGRVTSTSFSSDKIDYQETRYRWAVADVPAFKEEPYMTTYHDYISKINFELAYTKWPNSPIKNYSESWESINKQFAESEYFGREVTGNGFLKKTVEEITAGMTTPEAKVAALHSYVANNFLWDGTTRKYVGEGLKKVFDAKKGSSAELNMLLISMIEKTGIEVFPVLISTRDHGFLRENIPASKQFNNVIGLVYLADKPVLLDATEKLLPTGFIPERCLNGKGLAVSSKGLRWIELKPPVKSRRVISADLTLTAAGDLTGTITGDRSGYYGLKGRQLYSKNGEAEYAKDFIGKSDWQVSKSEFQNVKDLGSPFKESHTVSIGDMATVSGDVIYLVPMLKWQMVENPFKLEKRQYPVDFGSPFDETFIIKINLPAGYAVDEAPESKIMALPENAGKLMFNTTKTNTAVSITCMLQINRSFFAQTEYENLREFYARVVAKQAEQIVLKKI